MSRVILFILTLCALRMCVRPEYGLDDRTTNLEQERTERLFSDLDLAELKKRVDELTKRVHRIEEKIDPEGLAKTAVPDIEVVSKQRFHALYYSSGPTMIGEFTIDGPVKSTLRPLNGHLSKIVVDPERGHIYGRGHHDVYLVRENEKPLLIDQDSRIEPMSWLSAIAWDAKRDRLLASTFAGGGYLYEYVPAEKRWGIVCKPGLGVSAFVHTETTDKLYGVNLNTGAAPIRKLYEFNARGGRIAERDLSMPIETADGYGPTQLVWLNGWLYLIQSHPGPARGYLIDPNTGVVHRMNILRPHDGKKRPTNVSEGEG